jgi:hypothetical protein
VQNILPQEESGPRSSNGSFRFRGESPSEGVREPASIVANSGDCEDSTKRNVNFDPLRWTNFAVAVTRARGGWG